MASLGKMGMSVELCDEDRARLDRFTDAIEQLSAALRASQGRTSNLILNTTRRGSDDMVNTHNEDRDY